MIATRSIAVGVVICFTTFFNKFVDAAFDSYPLPPAPFDGVRLNIWFFNPADNDAADEQPPTLSDNTEIIGFPWEDDDETISYVDTIDPNMEQVIVDESTETISFGESHPWVVREENEPNPTTLERVTGTPAIPEPDDLDETPETVDSLDGSDEPTLPEAAGSDNVQAVNESANTPPGLKPVPDVSTADIQLQSYVSLLGMPDKRVYQNIVSVDFRRRRDPTKDESVQYVRAVTGFTAFPEPLDIWRATYSEAPPYEGLECFFTRVPIKEIPELFHFGKPNSEDIERGHATELFAPGTRHPSVKGATGVGCITMFPREVSRGFWGWLRGL